MQHHFEYYQAVLLDEQKMRQFSERQLRNMRAYTQEFIDKKQEEQTDKKHTKPYQQSILEDDDIPF